MMLYSSLAVILVLSFISSLGARPLNPILDAVEYEISLTDKELQALPAAGSPVLLNDRYAPVSMLAPLARANRIREC